MPKIPEISIPEIREIPYTPQLPSGPPVTLELGVPIVEMPGCVPVHPDAKLNPSLLQDDPGRVGNWCPNGQLPWFNPMDYSPHEFQLVEPAKPRANDSEDKEPQTADVPTIPRLPQPNAKTSETATEVELPKPFLEKALDGLPPVEAVVTTTTIAVVATTSALVAKPFAELILKTIKPTVKKTMTTIAKMRGHTIPLESVWERRVSQRERNLAIRTLRRALKP
jgi:hypothetical protein